VEYSYFPGSYEGLWKSVTAILLRCADQKLDISASVSAKPRRKRCSENRPPAVIVSQNETTPVNCTWVWGCDDLAGGSRLSLPKQGVRCRSQNTQRID